MVDDQQMFWETMVAYKKKLRIKLMGVDKYPYIKISQVDQNMFRVTDSKQEYVAKKKHVEELTPASLAEWLVVNRFDCD